MALNNVREARYGRRQLLIADEADPSKRVSFDLAALPAGSIITITVPSANFTPIVVGDNAVIYAEDDGGSFQVVAADLELAADAGSDDGTDPSFLAAIMGNLIGDAIAGEGNYLAGVIGAYSLTGEQGSDYPTAGLMGIIMDGATDADAAVLAVLDGSDPSSATRARAAFGVAVNNNEADSGVDYGLDLHAVPNPHYTDAPGDGRQGLNVAKAQMRTSDEVCWITGAGVPVDYTDGDPVATGETYAQKGSLYTDTTNGDLYINGGTQAEPIWKLVTRAA